MAAKLEKKTGGAEARSSGETAGGAPGWASRFKAPAMLAAVLSIATFGFTFVKDWVIKTQFREFDSMAQQEHRLLIRAQLRDGAFDSTDQQAVEAFASGHFYRNTEVAQQTEKVVGALRLAADHFSRGTDAQSRAAFAEAAAEFEGAAKYDDGDARIFLNLGVARAKIGDFGKARDAYERATQLTPDDWRPRYNLCLLFLRQEQSALASYEVDQLLPLLGALTSDERRGLVRDFETDAAWRKHPQIAQRLHTALALAPRPVANHGGPS